MSGAPVTHLSAAGWWLQAGLAVRRVSVARWLAGLACVMGAAGWLLVLPHARAEAQATQQRWLARDAGSRANAARFAVAVSPAALPQPQGLDAFDELLGESHFVEQQIKTMFAIAGGIGLPLDQAEYKFSNDDQSDQSAQRDQRDQGNRAVPSAGRGQGFQTYRIVLPVKGSYPQLRQFCEQMLAAVPFASLDEMSLRRDSIAQPVLEGRLRFTLYLAPVRTGGAPPQAPAAASGVPSP